MRLNISFYIISCFIFLVSNQNFANSSFPKLPLKHSLFAVDATPIIAAKGELTYCPRTSVKIVTDIIITDPTHVINEIYIQISAGYVNGQDELKITNPELYPSITTSWNPIAGKLKLSSLNNGILATYTDFIAAIKDVEFSNSSDSPSGTRSFSITIGQADYLPRNGHFYQYITNTGISWIAAKAAAENSTYFGLKGYLATITSGDEAQFCGSIAPGFAWIGGSDSETESVWKWVTGPETGTIFWNGVANGSSPTYANWSSAQPNNKGISSNYAHIREVGPNTIRGTWNDLTLTGDLTGLFQPKGYIVEYGEMPGDPILQIYASTSTIVIPRIESTTPDSICGSGRVTLQATASNGNLSWYNTKTGGSPLASGTIFTTPNIAATTTYYVDAIANNCTIPKRIPVIATVNVSPTVTSIIGGARNGEGMVTLEALASAGIINWYDSVTGGTLLFTGNLYTTDMISTTTTYYVEAYTATCKSTTRIPITAKINNSPIITATGNQTYCPRTSMKIVTDVTISDPDNVINEIYIQISAGYVNGQDILTLNNALSHPTIRIEPFNANTGKLRLYESGPSATAADFEAAIKDIEFSNSSTSPTGIRNFSISIGQASYLPRNKHFYQYFSSPGISWTAAKDAAANKNYYGLQGYLATLTAADEAQISGAQATGNGWIGGSDAESEGVWKWVTGPEAGTVFWNGAASGSTAVNQFAFWNTGEPNNSNGNEHYAHVKAPGVPGDPGSWNDLQLNGDSSGDYQSKGYIVEYGGMVAGDVDNIQISASTTIVIPRIESTTPDSICGSGSVTLQATASNGNAYWYTAETGDSFIAAGNSFTTPTISTTTSYYVDATNGNCPDVPRTEVIATVKTLPTITSTSSTTVCNAGTATLGATASAGTINWYKASTGGAPLGSGTTFTTPSINTTTTYYVDAIASGCTSQTRTAVTATVNEPPTVSSTTPSSVCGAGTVTLEADSSSGNINWYDSLTGGSSLSSGNSFTTPTIDTTTTYYAEPILNGCTGPRTGVTATVYPIATTMEEMFLCQGESTTLDASTSGMKYLWSPGGETTQRITVSTIGLYSVTISSPAVVSCDSKKDISVTERPEPIISSVLVNENSITIELVNSESYYEYSINGLDFQVSNQFSYISSGQYTAFARDNNKCNLVTQDFTVFTVPKYFTPNNDGFNDLWEITEMADYPNSSAQIYNRYGKLIITLTSSNNKWDGKYSNALLPADDYWYRLKLDDSTPEMTGHFTLKR
jgi:gliding motility-associated-like protein